jgi:hypothetical protein
MRPTQRWLAACTIALSFAVAAAAPASAQVEGNPGAGLPGRGWIAQKADKVCGLRSHDQLSNPAVVDYDALLDATPEMKKLKDQGIGRDTPEGIRLIAEATTRVTAACERARDAAGHCSVWKAIQHKDGRQITDLTAKVKAQL